MTTIAKTPTIGFGSANSALSLDEMREIVKERLADVAPGSGVLAIIPDKTRDDNTHLLFPLASEALISRGISSPDVLVAQGTHPPMSEPDKLIKIGADRSAPPWSNSRWDQDWHGQIFDHAWNRSEDLVTLGELGAAEVHRLTGGLMDQAISLTANRLVGPKLYDKVLVFGATMPHEVAGFSGGAKYFFPGVAGPELTHATHWLGALSGIEHVMGKVETPIRALIEAAADFVTAEVISFNSVVSRDHKGNLQTHALFAGDIREAFRRAAAVSAKVHIKYTGRRYRRVIALLDEHYDDMWVGGKASYKLGGVIEDSGELLIYAPHLKRISETHGALIERYGYAPIEKVRQLVAEQPELKANLCVAAHLAHVAYAGRLDSAGEIVPRYRITLASAIDEDTCRRVNLGFMNHQDFRIGDYIADPNTLVVERAGVDLYSSKNGT
jgi:nickel-dependent lactate racemase